MKTLINGRTPEEIMRRMECWNRYYAGECNDGNGSFELRIQQCVECETRVPGYRIEDAFRDVWEYAKQLERERDAAIGDIQRVCAFCAHREHRFLADGKLDDRCGTCIYNGMCNWQWRGPRGSDSE